MAACLLAASLLVSGCKRAPKPAAIVPAATVVIADDTLKDDWTAHDLFQNVLDQTTMAANEITLDSDTAHLEIRAFQHRFFDDTARLKPTWVVSYVKADIPFGQESLPAPTLRATWGEPAYVNYVSRLDETLIYNTAYPYFKKKQTDTDSCRWSPIVYDIRSPRSISALADMLYPTPTFLNGIPICRATGTADSLPEMSSYYGNTVHLHGANVSWHNDGYVNSAHLPFPATAPPRSAITFGLFGPKSGPETNHFASYTYPNTFPEGRYDSTQTLTNERGEHGAILWYHDHAMMRTTANVYAGLAGAYIIEGKNEYQAMDDANVYQNLNKQRNPFRKAWDWVRQNESNDISLMINDKSFSKKGFLYYNSTSSLTDSDTEPGGVQPEFLGNTIAVNGKVWPRMEVDAETYRFRLLNTSSSRFFRFGLRRKRGSVVEETGIDSLMVQIGTEGGLMPKFVKVTTAHPLTLAPGERADVLIDFGQAQQGDSLMLVNYAPNEVYQDDKRDTLTTISDTNLVNFVMAFVVVSDGQESGGKLTRELNSLRKSPEYQNSITNLGSTTGVSKPFDPATITTPFGLTLAEMARKSDFPSSGYPVKLQNLATYPLVLMSAQSWDSEAEPGQQSHIKNEPEGKIEIWAIMNTTGDRHPIHIHLNRFKIKGRWAIDDTNQRTGTLIPTEPNELGWKDVVQCPPGQITYIEVRYLLNKDANQFNDPANQFVYHCHILEHEDAGMMRRLVVLPKAVAGVQQAGL